MPAIECPPFEVRPSAAPYDMPPSARPPDERLCRLLAHVPLLSGFTDEELRQLDSFVRNNTVDSFGPVRQVAPELVFEVAFDSVHRSTRHKSGVAMRFPRISRIRWDKPANEADRLETLQAMVVE